MKTYEGMQTFRQEWALANALGPGMFAKVFKGDTNFEQRCAIVRAYILSHGLADEPIQKSTFRGAFLKTYGEPLVPEQSTTAGATTDGAITGQETVQPGRTHQRQKRDARR
jgi:hypothetical protein